MQRDHGAVGGAGYQRSLKAAHKVYIMQSGRIRLEGRPQDLSQEDIRKAYFGV